MNNEIKWFCEGEKVLVKFDGLEYESKILWRNQSIQPGVPFYKVENGPQYCISGKHIFKLIGEQYRY